MLGCGVKLCIFVVVLCIVDYCGGLDVFMVKVKDSELFDNVLKIKKEIVKV